MARLTAKARASLPASAFVFPAQRRYPIHDAAHARNALARVSQFGSSTEKGKVRRAVGRKWGGKVQVSGKRRPMAKRS